MEAVLPIVIQVLSMIPSLLAASANVVPLVQATEKALTSGSPDPTSAEWQVVNDMIAANTVLINTDPPSS